MNSRSRHSKQREAILSLLRSTKSHPTAEWLYSELKRDYQGIGLATVYRNLKLFEEQGLVIKLDVGDGFDHYDADTSNHYHFYCDCCKRLIDLDISPMRFDSLLPDGFSSNRHQLLIYGRCDKCKSEQCSQI